MASVGELRWDFVASFFEGRASVVNAEKYGFVNQTGEVVINTEWDCAMSFAKGLAPVRRERQWGFIDLSGELIIPLRWYEVGDYFADNLTYFSNLENSGRCGPYGYINRSGDVVIDPVWEWACPFSEGLGCVQRDGKEGFLDTVGKIVIEPRYDFAGEFLGRLAWVQMEQDGA